MIRVGRLLLVFLLCPTLAWGAESYRYWDWGQSQRRDDYQFMVLQKALEATRAEYGDFQVERVQQQFSTSRARREINSGTRVNVRSGPYVPAENIDDPAEVNQPVGVPILFNLLGYQRLVTQRERLPALTKVETIADLQAYELGVGRGWVDVDIYRHNGFNVNDGAHVTTLVAMLELGRFDLLPSTLMDYQEAIAAASQPELLGTAPGLVLRYPFPVMFYVGKNDQARAARIRAGLERLTQSGELRELFTQYFEPELTFLAQPGLRVIALENPHLEADAPVSGGPSIP
ncbi:transporter substrate-binding domain-containing protein [Gilvimarinus xylanilyticus]|uniref:Transporter substrate-binding domain-containing protein n=1 Tax=Gilvimarinus xylanilyticus TaxID=2944139 RepID=A0A9X2KS76_9GAMM|nr:transporter substrate-binding domain-containing protein [Gilvimarinus xylanilyticus]MCP8897807.1 transporter substrate-binding domain-containing protein [Gilvimarinus xylanilyticus]